MNSAPPPVYGRSDRPGRPRPTIRDVAAAAGVSIKTVSRVLNGEPAVLPEAAMRVREAIGQLGYHRNEAAASLRRTRQQTRIVGLIIEDITNPFYSAMARAVEAVTRQNGHLLFVANSDEDSARERQAIAAFIGRRVDGLIIVPTGSDLSILVHDATAKTRVVFVDRPVDLPHADSVLTANAEGACAGVAHLVSAGHRRVAYVGDQASIHTAVERKRGYEQALRDANIPVDAALVCMGLHSVAEAEQATVALLGLARPPTAIFAGNNRLTVGVLRAVHRQTGPVAVVGFDDFELADLLDPPVTVVRQDPAALGRVAAELLFRRLNGDRSPVQRIILATSLIVRGSGEVAP